MIGNSLSPHAHDASFTHPAGYATTPDNGSHASAAFLDTVKPKTFSRVA